MSTTSEFKTKSEICKKESIQAKTIYPIALDLGYSGVKGMSPHNYFCFPSFVRECTGELLGAAQETDIFYRDETATYAVGAIALDGLAANDTNDSANTLFGRNRYFSPSFLILARVGLALGMQGKKDDLPIFLQTGLPPAYRKADTPLLIEALAGSHVFSVKIGTREWTNYNISLSVKNIGVLDQPMGSVYSASKQNDGTTFRLEDGKSYVDHRMLVFDGGFGTTDVFSVAGRVIDSFESFNDVSMKAVFTKTTEEIRKQCAAEVHVHTLQNYLEQGLVPSFNRRTHTSRMVPFASILLDNSRKVCESALEKMENAYNGLIDYEYLIVTGGTGAAWLPFIKTRYRDMETLKVVTANQNDTSLPHIYSNVRGYYFYRIARDGARS